MVQRKFLLINLDESKIDGDTPEEKTMNTAMQQLNNLRTVAKMLVDASSGVLQCHAQGIIHRDVAARNFLVDPFNRVTLCDFGMSVKLEPGKTEGSRRQEEMLPLAWCAPELLTKFIFSEKTDVYAFGIFLYEVLDRKAPFEGLSWVRHYSRDSAWRCQRDTQTFGFRLAAN